MIKNLPPDKLNNGAERSRYRKRNIQIGVPCSLNAFYTYNNAQELIHSTSAEQFGHKTFPQLFNDNQNNTTIPHFEITDPLPNPWLRGARVIKAAAHPAQRQQQPFSSRNTEQQQQQQQSSVLQNTEQQKPSSVSRNIEEQQGFVTANTEQQQEQSTDSKDIEQQEQSTDSKDIEQQEASNSTNTEQQQNQAVATVPANTGICSASMQNQEAPEAIKPVAEGFRRLHAAQNPFQASQQQHLQC
ncbi:unnamed protein product [Rotaria sp. Silwood1]|nr:unnamed protein product [Rotaria sp. Silwood1]